jgi:hypothetical protein
LRAKFHLEHALAWDGLSQLTEYVAMAERDGVDTLARMLGKFRSAVEPVGVVGQAVWLALYHNTRPLKQRGNLTPLQLAGVDLGDDDWVRLIERELRYGQAAVAQQA